LPVALLAELGFATANKWDAAKLKKRLTDIESVVDEDTKPTTKEGEKLLEEIRSAVKDGDEFEIEDDEEEAPAKGKGKGGKKDAKPAAKKEAKKAKPAKEEAKVDKFGSREGTNNAKINAALTGKPQKMADIVKKAGLEGTYYNHLNKMVEAGHFVKSDEGYALKK
jgi:hypothetical protein